MFLLVARVTFRFTRKKHLNDKLQPENRAVLITGCDSGFGHALAKHLDSQGFPVFASCLNPSGPGAKELTESCSKRLQILALDVTNDESAKKALEFVKENLGPSELWAIVNNAGIQKGFTVELSSIDDFKACLDVNAIGPVRVTKCFLPLLRQSRGRVVNITSIVGRIPAPHFSSYVMSKYAAVGFNDSLRQELDVWGIRVISVEPEMFETGLTSRERLCQCIDSCFESIDDHVKADYGEKYLKNFKIYMEYHLRLSSPKINKVVSAVEDAISMEYPKTIYRPSRSCLIQRLLYVYELLPPVAKDLISKFVLYVTGFPRPIEANI